MTLSLIKKKSFNIGSKSFLHNLIVSFFFYIISTKTRVQIASVDNWNVICSLPRPKAFAIKFSPKGTYLATLEHYSTPKDGSEPHPNFCVYRVSTGEAVFAIINKSFPDDWMPGWSNDEGVFALMVGGEAYFYETNGQNGFQKSANKIGGSRGGELSIAGGGSKFQFK